MRNVVSILGVVAIAAACRGKPKRQAPPANVAQPAQQGSAGGPQASPDLQLPTGPGTPPIKTTKPLARADFDRLIKLAFPRFGVDVHALNDEVVEVRQTTNDFPKLRASIAMAPCTYSAFEGCQPLELDKWKDNPKLKELVNPRLRDRPDTKFEVGTIEVRGTPMIYTYQLGYYWPANGLGTYEDSYALYWNDGVNKIRVVAQYADDPANVDGMLKKAPREDLEAVAKSFMDVYTHAWAPTS